MTRTTTHRKKHFEEWPGRILGLALKLNHTCNIKLLTIEEYKVLKVLTMKIFQTQ